MKSSCRAGLHREPLNSASSTFHQVKRVSGMHLKPYLKLQRKERSEISQDSLRGPPMSQRSTQDKYTNNCTKLRVFPKPPLVTPSRKLLGIIYPNTMCNMSGKGPADGLSAREKKNVLSATIHQGEEGEGPLDVWAVVKPGNTKEKIAFFAAQQCSGSNRLGSMKLKSTWDIDGRTVKRRKKTVDLKKAKIQLERMREVNARCSQPEPFACGIEHCSVHYVNDSGEGVFPGRSLSVIEMVAFLEQRASALLVDCAKTCTSASTARLSAPSKGALPSSDPFSAAGPCEVHERGGCGSSEQQQSEPVRVLDMVAKLESECLRRQSERDGGSLSRNNSFRRNVGRVLLASSTQHGAEPGRASVGSVGRGEELGAAGAGCGVRCGDAGLWDGAASAPQPFPPGLEAHVGNAGSGLAHAVLAIAAGRGDAERRVEPPRALPALCPAVAGVPVDSLPSKSATVDCTSKEAVILSKQSLHPARKEPLCISISVTKTEKGCQKEKLPPSSLSEDPLPGRLFFLQAEQNATHAPQPLRERTQEKPGEGVQNEDEDALESDKSCVRTNVTPEPSALSVPPPEGALQVLDASCLKRQVSHDFLETRFKIQQLLEPQQYMAFLPHHIIVKIFGLLPTRSLVALKCTCYYFKFIIEYYNIRPADSRWVRDPRYREDPCKQCKKKYVKGDVSLCRWHPKPYCQALPYGPGYWMCCHRSQKGIPGCKLGLHDNHWVPACHSFNRALHKKTRGAGAEGEEEY
ncbi:F-box only protein 34 isoform X1 [Coturnix japonica]|uniref:F-box protein 34 n=2 Tax=Coturnix japonica TaxID=93934 RepID=A0A8C2T1F1_COTJA|nr:F-box only protein 34 isoform X1 [Coturnix japonica]XP_015721324.1 F-box only protein 34 isoform X1 [Coturnix japonica]XP_015721325.1 F-box only protein 34 isoform X1 [Coturnix japonica]XP_015721326.1 F-box only protein 34 isoform X1 [Coturnix japonica]XP_015721328.1 F-box only protein 34 isoform X1 [Coturnix japonica]